MIDKYRIISNSITSKDDYNGTLTSQGQSRHPSSHFADNNYFFNVMYFIQNSNDSDIIKKSHLVLRYPSNYFRVKNDDEKYSEECKKQQEVFQYRFPPKFLWMWANRYRVIHPISLMAFRKFLNDVLKEVNGEYAPKNITNMKFDDFKKAK